MESTRHVKIVHNTAAARFSLACLLLTALVLGACIVVPAQSTEFLPEVDAHLTVNPYIRTYLQAKDDRDAGASNQFSIGPSVQFYLKPLVKLKQVAAFDLDDAKTRPLVLEQGYRYLVTPNEPSTQRLEEILTLHLPLKAGGLLLDRNYSELNWKGGKFTWVYRNRLTLQRTFAITGYHFIPYVAAEPYYESQYGKWSTTDLYAGALFPIGKHVQISAYYEHENNTGKSPNEQDNDFGLVLALYFSRLRK